MYYVIENFPTPTIVVEMETGNIKYFDTLEEAQAEADECQEGTVVKSY